MLERLQHMFGLGHTVHRRILRGWLHFPNRRVLQRWPDPHRTRRVLGYIEISPLLDVICKFQLVLLRARLALHRLFVHNAQMAFFSIQRLAKVLVVLLIVCSHCL